MTKPRLVSSHAGKPAPRAVQKSCLNPFDGRGRNAAAHRRAHGRLVDPCIYRASFLERWSDLIRHLFRTRDAVAVAFGVTFQTACNWWEGSNRPSGDKVALAALSWPEEFQRFMGA